MDMPAAISRVIEHGDLTQDEMTTVMRVIMTGQATAAQIGGFLVGLRMKGETVDEIAGAARVMRELATPVHVAGNRLVDTCGTGGSGADKFNVSTASAFVAAAAGARVAKHGNRAASGKSGSADLLEVAGAEIILSPEEVARCIDAVGVGFLFAVSHHGAMKHAIGPRREMSVRTLFNMLGPLTNPAGARRQVMGIYDPAKLVTIAEVHRQLGAEHVMVVHCADGLDEIGITTETRVAELNGGEIIEYTIRPEEFSVSRRSLDGLRVENPQDSLALVQAALRGSNEAASDMVALNAGAAIYVAGVTATLADGVEVARDLIGSGLAAEKMSEFVRFTRQLKQLRNG